MTIKYVVVVPMAGGGEMDLAECDDAVHACAVVRTLLACGPGSPQRVSVCVRERIDQGPPPVVTPPY